MDFSDDGSAGAASVTYSEAFDGSEASASLAFATTGSTASTAVGSTVVGSETLIAAYLTVSPSVRSRTHRISKVQSRHIDYIPGLPFPPYGTGSSFPNVGSSPAKLLP